MSKSTGKRPDLSWTNSGPELPERHLASSSLNFDNPSRRDTLLSAAYVFLFAVATRVIFVIYDGGFGYEPKADSRDFQMIAVSLANGTGYSRLYPDLSWRPTAYRMPLTPLFLAAIYKTFGLRPFTARLILAVLGAVACTLLVVVGICVLGRREGLRAGFFAGVLAAGDPFLVMNQTLILLEPLHVLLVAFLLLSALSYSRNPNGFRLLILAILSALIALNRPDGIAYALVAAAVAVLSSRPKRSRLAQPKLDDSIRVERPGGNRSQGQSGWLASLRGQRVFSAATVLGVTILAIIPWSIRNYRSLGTFVPLTTASGDLLLGANNQATYSPGPFYGYWAYGALTTGEAAAYGFAGEVRADRERRRLAFEYAYHHPLEAAAVVPIRILRGWDLFDPIGNARFGEAWGRPKALSLVALALYYPGLALAAVGGIAYRRMWKRMAILYLLPTYVTLLFAVATGEPRYRAGAQLAIWVLAGMGASRLLKQESEDVSLENE